MIVNNYYGVGIGRQESFTFYVQQRINERQLSRFKIAVEWKTNHDVDIVLESSDLRSARFT